MCCMFLLKYLVKNVFELKKKSSFLVLEVFICKNINQSKYEN